MTPAELDRLLKARLEPKKDKDGKCLHVRAYYQNFGSCGGEVCPDCHNIKLGGKWGGK
jgi:hypothetical protein